MTQHTYQTVGMIGLGYIGLPTAALLASRGISVLGVDINDAVVATINNGHIHIVEPDLATLTNDVVASGHLRATTTPEPADAFIIAVPTPFTENHTPDLSYIEAAIHTLSPVLRTGNLVILESTLPVGTTEQIEQWLAKARPDLSFPQQAGDAADIQIAYCPERVFPGKVLSELVENDRIIGGLSSYCAKQAAALYRIFVNGECLISDARTAEMCKLTENSFRDVNIAFANELSLLCDKFGVNVWELIRLANHHPRVNILQPGPGVGGHCIAVDPWFIISAAKEQSRLLQTARYVNNSKTDFVLAQIKKAAKLHSSPVIACFGLAFKADIDDLRESPALDIAIMLAECKLGQLLLVEPNIHTIPTNFKGMSHVELVTQEEALERANIIAMLVDHLAFHKITKCQLANKHVIDPRGMWQCNKF